MRVRVPPRAPFTNRCLRNFSEGCQVGVNRGGTLGELLAEFRRPVLRRPPVFAQASLVDLLVKLGVPDQCPDLLTKRLFRLPWILHGNWNITSCRVDAKTRRGQEFDVVRSLVVALIGLFISACAAPPGSYTADTGERPSSREPADSPRAESNLACGKWRRDKDSDSFGPDCTWYTNCRYDQVRDVRFCTVNSRGDYLLQPTPSFFLGPTYASARIGVNHHPGTSPVVRVDDNTPIYAKDTIEGTFSQSQTRALISQMRAGTSVSFSTTEWPGQPSSGQLTLIGFSAAHDFARQWLRGNG